MGINCSSSNNRPPNRNNKKNTNNDYKNKLIKNWTIKDVYSWLSTAVDGELAPTAKKFKKYKIDGTKLTSLTDYELNEMGITPDHQKRFKTFLKNQLEIQPKLQTEEKKEKSKGTGQYKLNQNTTSQIQTPNLHLSLIKIQLNQNTILPNVPSKSQKQTAQNDIYIPLDLDQIAEISVSEALRDAHAPITTYGTTGKTSSGNNQSSQQSSNNNTSSGNNSHSTYKYSYSNTGYNGGIGSSGGGGSGGGRRNNNDEKKNDDWTTDRTGKYDDEEEDDEDESSTSRSTLNPHAKAYDYEPSVSASSLGTVNEEYEYDERIYALRQLFQGDVDFKMYDFKYYNGVLNEAQMILKEIQRGDCNVSRKQLTKKQKTTGSTKKKKLKKSKKLKHCNVFGYNGIKQKDAESQFEIFSKLTRDIIPNMVCENMENYYSYVHKCITLQKYYDINETAVYCDGEIFIINLDLHCKKDNNVLYGIAHNVHNKRGYSWQVDNCLKTKDEIKKEAEKDASYDISEDKWPISIRESDLWKAQINNKNYIQNCMCDENTLNKIIKDTSWHKLSVFNRINKEYNKHRTIKSITKEEFKKRLRTFINENKSEMCNLIPIIMFNNSNENNLRYEIHYIWLVNIGIYINDNKIRIDENVNVGISYKYNNNKNRVEVSGIHLNKDLMYEQHQLVSATHMNECKCFDNFESNITYLEIGNCDAKDNLIKQLKQKNERLKDEIGNCEKDNLIKELKQENKRLKNEIEKLKNITTPSYNINGQFTTPHSVSSVYSASSHYSNSTVSNSTVSNC